MAADALESISQPISGDEDKEDGGTAFPTLETETLHPNPGMSLLDYFAAQAMIGIIAHPDGFAGQWDKMAEDAYSAAYAMLVERNGK